MISLAQIKEEIEEGVQMIYYSTSSCWWTHKEEDLIEATLQGRAQTEKIHKLFMNDKFISKEKKSKGAELYNIIKDSKIPTDPMGGPCKQYPNAKAYFEFIISDPSKFGFHELKGLELAHHQNCKGNAFQTWREYLPKKEIIKPKMRVIK
jgi:hypothetical protein